jgi:hypothetical protein
VIEGAGDGRLTRVFATMGQALRRQPFSLVLAGAISFLPLMLLLSVRLPLEQRFPFLSAWSGDGLRVHLPQPWTVVTMIGTALCFAILAGPMCALAWRGVYPQKSGMRLNKSFRAFLPMFLIWLGIFLLMLVWGFTAEIISRTFYGDQDYVVYVWLLLLLALLVALPAFLSLMAPVFALEDGTVRQKWQRMRTLGKGYGGRMIGYAMVCGLVGMICVTATTAGLVAMFPNSVRFADGSALYLVQLGLFWMLMCVLATALYCRLKMARGELDAEDVAEVFA